jgi:hypothetical protein
MGLLLSVVALVEFQGESATGPSEIRFLARHQSADGSWGEIPEDCRCLPCERPQPWVAPEGITVDPEIRRVIDIHIRNLGEDDIRVREASTVALLRLGDATGPQLAAAAEYEGPEVKFRCREVLQRLRDRDGPGTTETTSLALLCFLSMGYSPLSRDETDGRCFGKIVQAGLDWLLSRQDPDGSFDAKNPIANLAATVAITEAFGLTAIARFKEPSRRAQAAMDTQIVGDVRFHLWKGLLLRSAEISEVSNAQAQDLGGLSRILARHPGCLALSSSVLLATWSERYPSEARRRQIAAIHPSRCNPEELWVTAMAMRKCWPTSSREFGDWQRRLKPAILAGEREGRGKCEEGSWPASCYRESLQTTALRTLALTTYYRYACSLSETPYVNPSKLKRPELNIPIKSDQESGRRTEFDWVRHFAQHTRRKAEEALWGLFGLAKPPPPTAEYKP